MREQAHSRSESQAPMTRPRFWFHRPPKGGHHGCRESWGLLMWCCWDRVCGTHLGLFKAAQSSAPGIGERDSKNHPWHSFQLTQKLLPPKNLQPPADKKSSPAPSALSLSLVKRSFALVQQAKPPLNLSAGPASSCRSGDAQVKTSSEDWFLPGCSVP